MENGKRNSNLHTCIVGNRMIYNTLHNHSGLGAMQLPERNAYDDTSSSNRGDHRTSTQLAATQSFDKKIRIQYREEF